MFTNPAKKSLGQNFLTSTAARAKIIAAGEIQETDTVLEIGPGRGFLTEALLETKATVLAVEKDTDLIEPLRLHFERYSNLILIEGDALTYVPPEGPYKLIANIPYYITGAIFSRYLSHVHQPTTLVVLIQKEVAERIVARDGKESILSLSIKCYGTPTIISTVNRGSFHPAPTVDSAILCIKNISKDNFKNQYHEEMFFKVVKAGFLHKRKMLLSNLRAEFTNISFDQLFESLAIPQKARAEDVTLSTWLQLSLNISTHS